MIQIQPITLGLPSQEAVQISIKPLISSTTDTSCSTYYEVLSENNVILASGNVPISEEDYALWGDDNAFIEDIVLNQLTLKRL